MSDLLQSVAAGLEVAIAAKIDAAKHRAQRDVHDAIRCYVFGANVPKAEIDALLAAAAPLIEARVRQDCADSLIERLVETVM